MNEVVKTKFEVKEIKKEFVRYMSGIGFGREILSLEVVLTEPPLSRITVNLFNLQKSFIVNLTVDGEWVYSLEGIIKQFSRELIRFLVDYYLIEEEKCGDM